MLFSTILKEILPEILLKILFRISLEIPSIFPLEILLEISEENHPRILLLDFQAMSAEILLVILSEIFGKKNQKSKNFFGKSFIN